MADQAASGKSAGYSVTARVLHWITAVIVLCMIVVGFAVANEWGGKLLGMTLAVLAAMHIGAALYHHFVRKDRALVRMIAG